MISVRWMIKSDMPQVLEITDWLEEEIRSCLRHRNCIGMVAENGDRIVGLMIFELYKTKLTVINFIVSINRRREGIGTKMIEKLVNKLTPQGRQEILFMVPIDLSFLAFLKSLGFLATGIENDVITMRYGLEVSV